MVYVISMEGKPLMPCKEAKARKLVRDRKAKVVRRTPYTIQLSFICENQVQPITLGVDAGSKTVGLSASTERKELYAAEAILRNDIVDLLAVRKECRRTRRNRKTRYRQARFLNRKKAEKWVAPSVQHKIESHLKLVEQIHKILPISKIIVEVASFDIQKIMNQEIGSVGYQQGEQLDFFNVREYVLFRDGHKCQNCGGKSKDRVLTVHHIESRKTGGDAPNNLLTLCETCHDRHHRGEIRVKIKRGASFRDAAFMGIMRWSFYNKLKENYLDVALTYGYITKSTRIENRFEKTHATDAFCIAGNVKAERAEVCYRQKFVRKANRSLHKRKLLQGGRRKANKCERVMYGYQMFDQVLFGVKECFIFGRRRSGSFDIRLLDGTKISGGISYKKLKLLEHGKSLLTEKMV